MQASFSRYDLAESIDRIDEILNSSDSDYSEHSGVPSRNALTYNNGYYVDVTILFIDIRGSTAIAEKHTRPVLAKIYRAYISEVVAILKNNLNVCEINIEGDGIWAVFNTISKNDVVDVFRTAGDLSSLIRILNIKLKKKNYSPLKVGVGIDDGTALYIKTGYKGSGINEVVWIGKVVGKTAHLCSYGNSGIFDGELMISRRIWEMLPEEFQNYMQWNGIRECFQGNIHNVAMNEWANNNE